MMTNETEELEKALATIKKLKKTNKTLRTKLRESESKVFRLEASVENLKYHLERIEKDDTPEAGNCRMIARRALNPGKYLFI